MHRLKKVKKVMKVKEVKEVKEGSEGSEGSAWPLSSALSGGGSGLLAAGSLRLFCFRRSAVCGALGDFDGLITVCPLCWLPRCVAAVCQACHLDCQRKNKKENLLVHLIMQHCISAITFLLSCWTSAACLEYTAAAHHHLPTVAQVAHAHGCTSTLCVSGQSLHCSWVPLSVTTNCCAAPS
jgi:hypothetical protein